MRTEITKEQLEHEKNEAVFCIGTAANYGKHVVVQSGLFSPLCHYQNKAGEIVLGLVPDDHPTKAKDKQPEEEDKEIVYYVNEDRELVCTYVTYAEYREMERVHEGASLMIHALWDFGEQLKLPTPIPYAGTTTREWCHQFDE